MTVPKNRMSYADIYKVYDQALADPMGVRVPFNNRAEAQHYQLRMHQARAIDRKDNKELYPEGHALHNNSAYDVLQVRLREAEDGSWFVYVEHKERLVAEVESLSKLEAEDEANS